MFSPEGQRKEDGGGGHAAQDLAALVTTLHTTSTRVLCVDGQLQSLSFVLFLFHDLGSLS